MYLDVSFEVLGEPAEKNFKGKDGDNIHYYEVPVKVSGNFYILRCQSVPPDLRQGDQARGSMFYSIPNKILKFKQVEKVTDKGSDDVF